MNYGSNKDYVPEKKPKKTAVKRKILIIIIAVLVLLVAKNRNIVLDIVSKIPVVGTMISEKIMDQGDYIRWDYMILGDALPTPRVSEGSIWDNDEQKLMLYLNDYPFSEFTDYMEKAKEKGFVINGTVDDGWGYEYHAYNSEGYELTLEYIEYAEEMKITLIPPIKMTEYKWPNSEVAALLPVPDLSMGKVASDKAESLYIYVGDTSLDEYNSYVEACIENGFNVDYSRGDTYYNAYNAEGYYISLSYGGFNTMIIDADTPKEPEPEATPIAKGARDSEGSEDIKDIQLRLIELGYLTGAADGIFGAGTEGALMEFQEKNGIEVTGVADYTTISELESSYAIPKYEAEEAADESVKEYSDEDDDDLVDGIRPSVKEAIDSFEEYFTEYCELMEKIEKNPNNPLLLVDYAEFLATYDKTMRDFENMEDDDLNDAEMAYYLSALNRVNGMLINVAYGMD